MTPEERAAIETVKQNLESLGICINLEFVHQRIDMAIFKLNKLLEETK